MLEIVQVLNKPTVPVQSRHSGSGVSSLPSRAYHEDGWSVLLKRAAKGWTSNQEAFA